MIQLVTADWQNRIALRAETDNMGVGWETTDPNVDVSGAVYTLAAGLVFFESGVNVPDQTSAQTILDTGAPLFTIPAEFAPEGGGTGPMWCVYQDATDGLYRMLPLQGTHR